MNRSPLFYPMNRGMDAEAGGAADLQTDVMRFMAIISLCLVAIFALVQSIPYDPPPQITPSVEPDQPARSLPPHGEALQPEAPAREIALTRPEAAKPAPTPKPVVLERPKFTPVAKPAPEPVTSPEPPRAERKPANEDVSVPAETSKGFTLRFESDAALTRLVARDVVGLYAITPAQTYRMNVESNAYGFWPASAPGRFHEMDSRTVPAAVLGAFARSNPQAGSGVKWGVSIPGAMSRQLDQYLSAHSGGSLIIGADGTLRMEQ